MDELKELIDFLTIQKIKQVDILTEKSTFSTKTERLYKALKENEITTDEEAMLLIYGGKEPENYRKLKYRLTQRLINTIFFVDVQATEREEVTRTAKLLKNWAASELMNSKNLSSMSIRLAEKILPKAIGLERSDIVYLICNKLRFYYGAKKGHTKKFTTYNQLCYKHIETLSIHNEVESMYIRLSRLLTHERETTYNQDIINMETRLDALESPIKKNATYYINHYHKNALYFIGMIKDDMNLCKKACDEALAYYHRSTQKNKLSLFSFTQKYALLHVKQQDFENALFRLDECIAIINVAPGRLGWHYSHTYKFLVCILMKKFIDAYDTLSYIINHKALIKIPDVFRKHWYLKEAFMIFLVKMGRVDISQSKAQKLREFRYSRLVNEVSDSSNDATGFKITVNIIRILFLIVDKKHDELIDRLSALRQYSQRNLKGPKYVRQRTFVKMLRKLSNLPYSADQLNVKTATLRAKLAQHPFDYSEKSIMVEIIPYEQLWEELLEGLRYIEKQDL